MIQPDLDSTQFIDQVVRDVLKRIDPDLLQSRQRPDADKVTAPSPTSTTQFLSDPVLTEEHLKSIELANAIEIAQGTVLTPTALDYLRKQKISWKRAAATQVTNTVQCSSPWSLLILSDAQRLHSIANGVENCQAELVGSNTEAVSLAISQICRASVCGVLVCSDQCFEVACRANRQQKVRAVVVEDSNDVQAAREQVNANVFCVSPRSIPLYSIRNLFREITRLKPSPQEGWSD